MLPGWGTHSRDIFNLLSKERETATFHLISTSLTFIHKDLSYNQNTRKTDSMSGKRKENDKIKAEESKNKSIQASRAAEP